MLVVIEVIFWTDFLAAMKTLNIASSTDQLSTMKMGKLKKLRKKSWKKDKRNLSRDSLLMKRSCLNRASCLLAQIRSLSNE